MSGASKRSRREDGTRSERAPGADDLRELRDVIIHCDGSADVLGGLSSDMARDMDVLCDSAVGFVMECVTELPVKTPVYAALAGLVNSKASEFGAALVDAARQALEETLNGEDVTQRTRARVLTRFLVLLSTVGVVQRRDVMAYLGSLVQASTALARSGVAGWQPRADWLAYVALSALPWGGEFLSKSECANEFEELFDAADAYAKKRSTNPDAGAHIMNSTDGSDTDWFLDMCARLGAARTDGSWHIASIPAIDDQFMEELSSTANAHALGSVTIPETDITNQAESAARYPGRSMLRILDTSLTEGTGASDAWGPLERFVAEEYIVDTIWAFEPGYRRSATIPAAEQLASLPLPAEQPERCMFLVAETLFAELLALPEPTFSPVFYHIVIQDLCKIIPTFPPKMAKTVGMMFRAIDRVDIAARDRLSSWLAHQISCFDMVWPWSSWKHVTEQPDGAPQREFVKDVLKRLCQLSFPERVQKSLIEELHPLLPALTGLNTDYVAETSREAVFGKLQAMLGEKRQGYEVAQWINSDGAAMATPEVLLRALVVAALERGQKCITHHDVLLKRYSAPIRELTSKAGGEVVVDAAAGIWRNHFQMAPIAVERLLALDLVTPAEVVNWVVQRAASFGEDDTYEIASTVCDFVRAGELKAAGKKTTLMNKIRAAEAEAADAGRAAEDFASQGRMYEAQQASAAEARAVEEITGCEAELASADAPLMRARALNRETCVTLCSGLIKAASHGASERVASRVLALCRSRRVELADATADLIKAAGTKKTAKTAVAHALGATAH